MMNGEGDNEFMEFSALHAGALHAAGIPQLYWRTLHHKLNKEVFFFLQTSSRYNMRLVLLALILPFCQAEENVVVIWSFNRYLSESPLAFLWLNKPLFICQCAHNRGHTVTVQTHQKSVLSPSNYLLN